MAVSYKKLFHLLVDREMTAVQLQQQAGYSANITSRLRKNTYISLESVEKICRALDCKIEDIVEFIPSPRQRSKRSICWWTFKRGCKKQKAPATNGGPRASI